MEMKGITCKIPLELHNRISDEIRETESTMGKFIEMIINEHYTKEENSMSTFGLSRPCSKTIQTGISWMRLNLLTQCSACWMTTKETMKLSK